MRFVQFILWFMRLESAGKLQKFGLAAALLAFVSVYNYRCFKDMANAEAMDAAQLARNLVEGKGYNTLFIRPLSIYLLKKNPSVSQGKAMLGDLTDPAQRAQAHPDLANPPVYPLMLASLMKVIPKVKYQNAGSSQLWNRDTGFWTYEPDFIISLLNQVIFIASAFVLFFLARRLFDPQVAWTSAIVFLTTDTLWRFCFASLPTALLILTFLGLVWLLVAQEQAGREGKVSHQRLIIMAVGAGLLIAFGFLTRYSFGWFLIPVLAFYALFMGPRSSNLCLALPGGFLVAGGPWIVRNLYLSHTPFGVASFAILETTSGYPEHKLERSLHPDLGGFHLAQIWFKFVGNLPDILQNDLGHLGGSWIGAFFFVGLFVAFKSPGLRRLRWFALFSLVVLVVVQALGRTQLSVDSPGINTENVLILLAPLAIIFGVAFFFILFEQLEIPLPPLRRLAVAGFCLFLGIPSLIHLATPPSFPAWPPYYPPLIQRIGSWIEPKELMMSDVPWAVAWYGRRQCVWTTMKVQANNRDDFFEIYDFEKRIAAIYLTPITMDIRFLSEWGPGSNPSWGSFVLESMTRGELPAYFPLKAGVDGLQPKQLLLTDRPRWAEKREGQSLQLKSEEKPPK